MSFRGAPSRPSPQLFGTPTTAVDVARSGSVLAERDRSRVKLATRASLQRLGPVTAGAVAGLAAFHYAPDHATSAFFSTTAQVVPVLLLALAIEARLFGSSRRALVEHDAARRLERVRQVIEVGTVLALLAAEGQALWILRDERGADPWLAWIGLTWGFVTIAWIAVRGAGMARVTADLKIVGETPKGPILEVGVSNEFGDHDLQPLMNVMFGPGAHVFRTQQHTAAPGRAGLALSAPVTTRGTTIPCRYSSDRPLLTAGDAYVRYYRLDMTADEVLVVLRLDHVELDRGRIERAAYVRRDGSLHLITERTG
jgi:hypothetical protein